MHQAFVRPLALAIVLGAGACTSRPSVQVNTAVAPEARFGSYRTFVVLTPRMQNANPAASDDPMLENSITNRALRDNISQALVSRGYTMDGGPDADIAVAYYTAARQALDVTTVDYGYPYRPAWWGANERQEVRQINQGTVVIDVIDRRTNQLVWRGTGRTEVSTDQTRYTQQLARVVGTVLKKLPKAS
jgi:hypothetical protein